MAYLRHSIRRKNGVNHDALKKHSGENSVFYEDEIDIHLNPKICVD